MSPGQGLNFATFDVFTQTRFKGNPLAIVKVPTDVQLSQSQKQAIAREFNFSETVFLHEGGNEVSAERRIDIFTTTKELPFAGHPTIGIICCIAHNTSPETVGRFTLLTKAGPIPSKYERDTSTAIATIPHNVHIHNDRLERSRIQQLHHAGANEAHDDLLEMWPSKGDRVVSSFPLVSVVKGMTFILIGFPRGGGDLERIKFGRQLVYANAVELDKEWLPSFVAPYFYEILSERRNEPLKIRARMIEPSIGEDPATGSAASTLGAYIALQRGEAAMIYEFDIAQGVEMGRNSEIGVKVKLDGSGKAVEELCLSGSAVQVMEGTIML